MSKRIRRFASARHRRTVLLLLCIPVICIIGALVYFFVIRENPEAALYRYKAGELSIRIEKGTKLVYLAADYIPKGTVLSQSMTTETMLLSESVGYITESDFGGVALVDIPAGTELTRSLFGYTQDTEVYKEIEYELGPIPGNIQAADHVDIRLKFPDGADYIVLSKKQIKELDTGRNKAVFDVNETEILMMDSALVDAGIYEGAVLYLSKYPAPAFESASPVNYIPSLVICELIKTNPQIEKVFTSFDYEKRVQLEASLKDYLSPNGRKVSYGKDTFSSDKGGSVWD